MRCSLWFFGCLFLLWGCGAQEGGCRSDQDCKGDRICVNQQCVAADNKATPTASTTPAGPEKTPDKAQPNPADPKTPDAPTTPKADGPVSTLIVRGARVCASLRDGQLKCWGDNYKGLIGDPASQTILTPTAVAGLSKVEEIGFDFGFGCARQSDGAVLCWGENAQGQLGDGTTKGHAAPAPVPGISGAKQLVVGFQKSCVVLQDGAVSCWGSDFDRVFGSAKQQSSPMPLLGLSNVARLEGSCALLQDGSVSCWGSNFTKKPALIEGLSNAASLYGNCAILKDGTVSCFGNNEYCRLGKSFNSVQYAKKAIPIEGITGTTQLSGFDRLCAVAGGKVLCWGGEKAGRFGDKKACGEPPAEMAGLSNVAQLVGLDDAGCARLQDGTVSCWGENQFGQLGDGTTTKREAPAPVSGLSGVVDLQGGSGFWCALLQSGTVSCWGHNDRGQLGDGTTQDRSTPAAVPL